MEGRRPKRRFEVYPFEKTTTFFLAMSRLLWISGLLAGTAACGAPPCPEGSDGRDGTLDGGPLAMVRLPPDLGAACAARCNGPDDCPPGTICTRARYRDEEGHTSRFELVCVPPGARGRAAAGACTVAGELEECASRSCHEGQCVVACTRDADCLVGQRCVEVSEDGFTTRLCWYADDALERPIELGTHELRGGEATAPLVFAVPPETEGLGLVAEDLAGHRFPLTFVELRDAEDVLLFDLETILAWQDTPIRWLPLQTHGAAAMLAPGSTEDRVRFRHGRWTLRAGVLPGSTADSVRVRLRALPTAAGPGSLHLNVHLAPGLGVNAASASTDTRLQGVLGTVEAIFQAIGLRVVARRYLDDVEPHLSVVDSVQGPESEAAALLRGAVGEGLDVFLVRSIDAATPTLGLAGGVPGPFGEPGTSHSGVIVSYDRAVVGDGTLLAAQVLAHEIGHYLGLFHNQEGSPACAAGERPPGCAPFGGQDPIADTSTSDRNLMFWALRTFEDGSVNDELTEGQGFVLLRNPLVSR